MSKAYYNEINPYAAAWLRNLIAAGHIANGDVDERSIVDVRSSDLVGYTQCHFFAGIGVWSTSLRAAGWPDDRPVWTGSCPCQPFSIAGEKRGTEDERHLWPIWAKLIRERAPSTIFGEQVSSPDALTWLDFVQSDLERENYAVGVFDLCAAGFGAPHIRQRLYFVADADGERRDGIDPLLRQDARSNFPEASGSGSLDGMAEPAGDGRGQGESHAGMRREGSRPQRMEQRSKWSGFGDVGDADDKGLEGRGLGRYSPASVDDPTTTDGRTQPGPVNGFWFPADWIACRDGKYRSAEPGTFPLAHGATSRVGRLRAYGNAIVAPVAIEMISAFLSAESDLKAGA